MKAPYSFPSNMHCPLGGNARFTFFKLNHPPLRPIPALNVKQASLLAALISVLNVKQASLLAVLISVLNVKQASLHAVLISVLNVKQASLLAVPISEIKTSSLINFQSQILNFKYLMAQLTCSILGNVSGKLGDVVFKKVNGKTIICARPVSFCPDNSPGGIARRNKFVVNSLFASAANKIPVLKTLWQYYLSAHPYVANNPYTAISKLNYHSLFKEEISTLNFLAPLKGFEFHITHAKLSENKLIIKTEPLDPTIFEDSSLFIKRFLKRQNPFENHTNLHIVTLIHAKDCIDEKQKDFRFIPLTACINKANLLKNQTFSILFDDLTNQIISKYTAFTLITALIITTSKSDTPISNSITLHTPLS